MHYFAQTNQLAHFLTDLGRSRGKVCIDFKPSNSGLDTKWYSPFSVSWPLVYPPHQSHPDNKKKVCGLTNSYK